MMPSNDNLIVFAAALAATVFTALCISIWQGIASRRSLANTLQLLRIREEELTEARAEQRGRSVALDQSQQQLQEKLTELHLMKS